MTTFAVGAHAQLNTQGQPELTPPLKPLRPGVTAIQIFDKLLAHNALRTASLVNDLSGGGPEWEGACRGNREDGVPRAGPKEVCGHV